MNNNHSADDKSLFWNIGNELDEINAQLKQVQDMLQIYDEQIESDMRFVREHERDSGASYFISRYDMLHSLLAVTQLQIINISKSITNQATVAYDAHMVAKQCSE